ncbi:MAG: glycerol-3-phosphate 1-O-acyltransferase PlsY [Candidatus Omnitrophica bacterium]|nr:glycerol-3-phosphate 1-O-acyltransferase PlsY [Candidatus Omnitrophota bacterium]
MAYFFISLVSAYLIGSIPTSYILSRLKGVDIRQHGSGNIGATNTLRVMGKGMGVMVLVLDMLKGVICVLLLPKIFFNANANISIDMFRVFMAGASVFGHIWTIFLNFKGGKGVATTLGVFLALSPKPAIAAILIWLIVVILSKYVSLSSIIMMLAMPAMMLFFAQPVSYAILGVILCIVIGYTHRQNIDRLFRGTEHKIGEKIRPKP